MGTVASLATNVSLRKSLPYDPVRDFAPITLVATQNLMLLIHPSIPAKSVKELVALAEKAAGQAVLRFSGQRHRRPPLRRTVQAACADRHAARAVQRGGAGDDRCDQRPGVDDLRQHLSGHPQVAGRAAARAGGDRRQALAGRARTADDDRGRRQGLRIGDLVRPARAGRHAGGHRERSSTPKSSRS